MSIEDVKGFFDQLVLYIQKETSEWAFRPVNLNEKSMVFKFLDLYGDIIVSDKRVTVVIKGKKRKISHRRKDALSLMMAIHKAIEQLYVRCAYEELVRNYPVFSGMGNYEYRICYNCSNGVTTTSQLVFFFDYQGFKISCVYKVPDKIKEIAVVFSDLKDVDSWFDMVSLLRFMDKIGGGNGLS